MRRGVTETGEESRKRRKLVIKDKKKNSDYFNAYEHGERERERE